MFPAFRERRQNHRLGGQKASWRRWDNKETGLIIIDIYPLLARGLWVPGNGYASHLSPIWILISGSGFLEHWCLLLDCLKNSEDKPWAKISPRHMSYHSWSFLPSGSDVYEALLNIHLPPVSNGWS